MTKKSLLKPTIILTILTCVLYYLIMITIAKMELGGASPNEQIYGKLSTDVLQRAHEPYCTGVYVTPEATWLVGRDDGNSVDYYTFAKDTPNLTRLVYPAEEKVEKEQKQSGYGRFYGFSRYEEKKVSFISKLDKTGTFQLIAVVPEVACFKSTADGQHVYLFTALDRPEKSKAQEEDIKQRVIFQSDDQGKTWQWRKQGFFPTSEDFAWSLNPYFSNTQSVWSWRNSAEDSTLEFSPDAGATVENVIALKPLLVSKGRNYGKEITRHIVQTSADKAIVWTSQVISDSDDTAEDSAHRLTHRIPLTRKLGKWHAGEKTIIEDLYIEKILDNHHGNVIAHLYLGRHRPEQIALLNQETLEWQVKGELPSPFGLLSTYEGARNIYIGKRSIVASIYAKHKVPRWLYPWGKRQASISANAVYYSTDWGKSWSKLSIPGYLGVLGMEQDKVIWANPWYEDSESAVRSYDLVQ